MNRERFIGQCFHPCAFNTGVLRDLLKHHELPKSPSVRVFAPACVLIPIFDKNERAHMLAVLKADTKGYPWRNQVAFPGGHADSTDASPLSTAYREIKEELNIEASEMEVVGSIGHFQTIRQVEIEAFVGFWHGDGGGVRCDPEEIQALLEIPLDGLIATHVNKRYQGKRPDIDRLTYPLGGVSRESGRKDIVIWGATAVIIHFFLEHLRMIAPEYFGENPEKPSLL